jgi:4a-hydroxytetrahydrobiopterin dehydratase
MTVSTSDQLREKKCLPCEGGVQPYSLDEARRQVVRLPGWRLTHDGRAIRRDWTVKHFRAGMEFFEKVAELAEAEAHHPNLHLEDYRRVWIELSTHAIDGLSENDFILAAKIDQLPIRLKVEESGPN